MVSEASIAKMKAKVREEGIERGVAQMAVQLLNHF